MRKHFEVWFYIGAMLSLYGVLLTGAGMYQWKHPPPTFLANEHAVFWAGTALLSIGLAYVVAFWPWRKAKGHH